MFNLSEDSIVLPGRIINFDATLQVAEVLICMDRIWSSSQQNPTTISRANLIGVPVQFPMGGDYCMTFPVAADDPCLLVFSQVGYDHWLYDNEDLGGMLEDNPVPHLRRNFDEEDGFCILFKNRPTAVDNYSPTDLEIRSLDSTQVIALKADGSMSVDTPGNIDITTQGSVNVVSTGNVNVTAPIVAITGDLTVTGTITAEGEVTGVGVALSTHTHGGVQGGTGNTAPPN